MAARRPTRPARITAAQVGTSPSGPESRPWQNHISRTSRHQSRWAWSATLRAMLAEQTLERRSCSSHPRFVARPGRAAGRGPAPSRSSWRSQSSDRHAEPRLRPGQDGARRDHVPEGLVAACDLAAPPSSRRCFGLAARPSSSYAVVEQRCAELEGRGHRGEVGLREEIPRQVRLGRRAPAGPRSPGRRAAGQGGQPALCGLLDPCRGLKRSWSWTGGARAGRPPSAGRSAPPRRAGCRAKTSGRRRASAEGRRPGVRAGRAGERGSLAAAAHRSERPWGRADPPARGPSPRSARSLRTPRRPRPRRGPPSPVGAPTREMRKRRQRLPRRRGARPPHHPGQLLKEPPPGSSSTSSSSCLVPNAAAVDPGRIGARRSVRSANPTVNAADRAGARCLRHQSDDDRRVERRRREGRRAGHPRRGRRPHRGAYPVSRVRSSHSPSAPRSGGGAEAPVGARRGGPSSHTSTWPGRSLKTPSIVGAWPGNVLGARRYASSRDGRVDAAVQAGQLRAAPWAPRRTPRRRRAASSTAASCRRGRGRGRAAARRSSTIASANIPRRRASIAGPSSSHRCTSTSVSPHERRRWAGGEQPLAQLAVVVDLAVEHGVHVAGLVRHRLVAGVEVDDAQAPIAERAGAELLRRHRGRGHGARDRRARDADRVRGRGAWGVRGDATDSRTCRYGCALCPSECRVPRHECGWHRCDSSSSSALASGWSSGSSPGAPTCGALDGDEAVWGLMARRVADGELTAFMWGQGCGWARLEIVALGTAASRLSRATSLL